MTTSEGKWDGKERRSDVCPFHHQKDKQIEDLEKSKVSFTVLKIVISIILVIGGSYWYHQDMEAKARFDDMLEIQSTNTDLLQEHIRISSIMLRNMSEDVRETKLNLETVMKKEQFQYQKIPKHHWPTNGTK